MGLDPTLGAPRYKAVAGVDGSEIQDISYPHELGGRLVENLPGADLGTAQDYACYLNECWRLDMATPTVDFDAWHGVRDDHGIAASMEPEVVQALLD